MQACCRVLVGLYQNDVPCLCYIFGATNLTDDEALQFLTGCGADSTNGLVCDGTGEI